MQFSKSNPTHDVAQERLLKIIDDLKEVLSPQYPIKNFVHHNSIEGLQHYPFPEALKVSEESSGAKGFLDEKRSQAFYHEGRINQDDLQNVLKSQPELQADTQISAEPKIDKVDVVLNTLVHGIKEINPQQLNWTIEELEVLTHFQDNISASAKQGFDADGSVAELWKTCLEKLHLYYYLQHSEEMQDVVSHQAEQLLKESAEKVEQADFDESIVHFQLRKESLRSLDRLLGKVGDHTTLREIMLALTGHDIMDDVTPLIVKHVSAFLDQGFSAWHSQYQKEGFYKAWKTSAEEDIAWLFEDFNDWKDELEILPDDAIDTVIIELRRLGLDDELWYGYLEKLSQQLPGWSGMFLWRHRHQGFDGLHDVKVDMIDYLAVRLVMERMFAQRLCRNLWKIEASIDVLHWYFRHYRSEYYVRYQLYNTNLPEYLQTLAHQQMETARLNPEHYAPWKVLADMIWTWKHSPAADEYEGHSVTRDAWPLFRLCQYMGINAQGLAQLDEKQVQSILDTIKMYDVDQRGFIWLQAYENHFRDQILNALVVNHQKGRWQNRKTTPKYQLSFCMDDREEGFRRYLEAANPQIETFGAAGFYSIPFNWKDIDDTEVTKLCPVVVTPSHQINATVAKGQDELYQQHVKNRTLRIKIQHWLFDETRRTLISATILSVLFAPISFVLLLLKMLVPKALSEYLEKLKQGFDKEVVRDIAMTTTDEKPATTQDNRLGFTEEEQVNMIATLLTNIGINKDFASIFLLMGHDSTSVNNPHLAGYSCGACSGRSGGPNAMLFARMANKGSIREKLKEKGIEITDTTWFVAAEHLTSSEKITYYDEHLIPENFKKDLESLKKDLLIAQQLSARERSRRMASAPLNMSPQKALNHVIQRSTDISQARPELGHATNASAFIGRRSATEGLFLDRRMFLISYDHSIDPTGEVIERLILANGPVGAGINLEYYFSSVDPENYGCGSKVTHNVSGNLGVMDGTTGDLKTGLPTQMTEVHEPMRLLVIVEASVKVLTEIYTRQPAVQELVGHGWINLVSQDPETGEHMVFEVDKGFVAWQGKRETMPEISNWQDYYDGENKPLKPATIYPQEQANG